MNEIASTFGADVTPPRPGRQLALAREGCALSIVDVARELRLSQQQVEALEADDYQRLAGPVFVRGYIRRYAHLVKLDPAPLLASVEQQLQPVADAIPEMPQAGEIALPTGREFRWHKYAIVALILLTLVVIFEFYRDDAIKTNVAWRPVVLPRPQVAADMNGAKEGLVAKDPAPATVERPAASAMPVKAPAAVATPVKAPAATGGATTPRAAAAEPPPGGQLIRLAFDRDSWVEIQDRNGRVIFSQLNSAGTDQLVGGLPPFTLVVGNATGVRLIYRDQPVGLLPHTQSDVARLTLK